MNVQDVLRIPADLFKDGYKLLGIFAPILSISFTVAKAAGLQLGLQHVSYAWALGPILLWVLVAYVRRCLFSYKLEDATRDEATRQERLAALSSIRQRGVQIRNGEPGSQAELDAWEIEGDNWITEAYAVAGSVSATLRARLETLDEMGPVPDRVPEISPSQVHRTEVMSEMLRRIGAYLEKHQ